ncbi:MAG: cell division protein FtsH, partial [Chloroflexi bacterium]|nr:cell division protein FtsH [Chloroflexota bacterium]
MSSRWMRNSLIYLLIVITVITVFFLWFDDGIGQSREIPISEVIARAKSSDRLQIEVTGDNLTITDGSQTFKSRK